jgi:hypothetical protein
VSSTLVYRMPPAAVSVGPRKRYQPSLAKCQPRSRRLKTYFEQSWKMGAEYLQATVKGFITESKIEPGDISSATWAMFDQE